ncbi:MAG: hypothetical protein JO122_15845, partial [Acetobacteraceae bacterium]|nr:hypothetical protein [Acetobacteraceae bacterium]
IASALREIKSQQATIRKQAASIASLKAQVNAGAENVRQIKQQLAARQAGQERTALLAIR